MPAGDEPKERGLPTPVRPNDRNEIGIARLILGVGRQLKLLNPSETIPDEAAPRRLVKPPPKNRPPSCPSTWYAAVLDAACARDGPTAGSRATDPPSTHLRVKHSDLGTALYHAPHHGAATRIVEAPDILLLDHSERDKRGRTHRGGGGIGTAVVLTTKNYNGANDMSLRQNGQRAQSHSNGQCGGVERGGPQGGEELSKTQTIQTMM
ncbi:hypothetical protein THAOC_28718 [Thalassiosira oceanica]|uniref:Uncharacterized protein n=1 Tax=Thalassiosira oceanica TaxID=159749 RepID=K0REA5_THAOC|nr:hypothetical protein THAOC_28718 [Thalassiosira oceanica]|eukprot:EJK52053.1 hypothetical protein THAOC_28718 [Thalassiosira oceanica]